jgi:membrane dipeptidase
MAIHRQALLIDGHNDLPWELRTRADSGFEKFDVSQPQPKLHTDIPRLRKGGLGGVFWSAYVPADTIRTGNSLQQTLEQIDLVHRMVRRYPQDFELALTADDIERIHTAGKIASLIGIEGGHSIQNSLGVLRQLHAMGARYMTLTHSDTLDWADSATDDARHGGLAPFGEDVVREMNRLGMLVDISHVSPETMQDALRISKAPVIASHSSAFAIAQHPRNVPDDVLKLVKENGGVVMINFFSGFVVPESAQRMVHMFQVRRDLRAKYADDAEYEKAVAQWRRENPIEPGTIHIVVDHIDHVVKVAGIDHVGLGSDFDGITTVPAQLEDVSCYPLITQELLNRGYTAADIHQILGRNVLRALRRAEEVARSL